MTTLRLILGDQLNPQHSWFSRPDSAVVYVLMEVRQEIDYVLHHAQKILAIFAAGHRVHYLAFDDPENMRSLPANVDALIAHYSASAFVYQAPDEWRLNQQMASYGQRLALPACLHPLRREFLKLSGVFLLWYLFQLHFPFQDYTAIYPVGWKTKFWGSSKDGITCAMQAKVFSSTHHFIFVTWTFSLHMCGMASRCCLANGSRP